MAGKARLSSHSSGSGRAARRLPAALLHQDQIQLFARVGAVQIGAKAAGDVQPQVRVFAAEVGQQLGGGYGEILRHADPQHAVAPDAGQRVVGFFIQRDDAACVAQQLHAFFGQQHLMRGALKQRLAQHLFQPAHLLANGGLRQNTRSAARVKLLLSHTATKLSSSCGLNIG